MRIVLTIDGSAASVGEEFAATRALRAKKLAIGRDSTAAYAARNRAAGLCRKCPRIAMPGRSHCAVCSARESKGVLRRRSEKKGREA